MTHPTDLSGKRIAIVKLSAIGDVVEVLPVVQSLRAAAPGAHLTWIIQQTPYELVSPIGVVDEFVLFNRRAGWRGYRDLYRATRDARWDLVLDLQVALKAGLVTAMLRAPRKLGFDRARTSDLNWLFTNERILPRPAGHRLDQYLEFVDHLGVPRQVKWGLGSTAAERERYADVLLPDPRPTVGLVLASTGPERNWPAENVALLADRLVGEVGARIVLLGAPSAAENAVATHLAGIAPADLLDLRAWDLRRLVYLLERMDVVVAPDTGPMHIAVAVDTPTVALFGYTNPKRAGPYGFRDLMVDAYGEPGEEYDAAAGYRPGRMDRILPEMVLEKVWLALSRYPRGPGKGTREEADGVHRAESAARGPN